MTSGDKHGTALRRCFHMAAALLVVGAASLLGASASADHPCAGGTLITGTGAADSLVGTAGTDCIDGLGGNDSITGLGGHDHITGGTGNDSITGGNEAAPTGDLIQGDAGNDSLTGGTGNDNVQGGSGFDSLDGGFDATPDMLDGGTETDTCRTRAGDPAPVSCP